MTISLYVNNSPAIKLDKNLTMLRTLTGDLREESSLLDPSIMISDIGDIIGQANYVHIQEFARYYYVTGVDYVRANLWRLRLHVDVLMTYKDSIRQQQGIIERNANSYNLQINDGLFVTEQKPRIATFAFPAGFTSWDFVLGVSGTSGNAE